MSRAHHKLNSIVDPAGPETEPIRCSSHGARAVDSHHGREADAVYLQTVRNYPFHAGHDASKLPIGIPPV